MEGKLKRLFTNFIQITTILLLIMMFVLTIMNIFVQIDLGYNIISFKNFIYYILLGLLLVISIITMFTRIEFKNTITSTIVFACGVLTYYQHVTLMLHAVAFILISLIYLFISFLT